jgi:hypothetical protein
VIDRFSLRNTRFFNATKSKAPALGEGFIA